MDITWYGWFARLDPSFTFLLTLPFVVAAAGLWARRGENPEASGTEKVDLPVRTLEGGWSASAESEVFESDAEWLGRTSR